MAAARRRRRAPQVADDDPMSVAYLDPGNSGSLGGVERLARAVGADSKAAKEWLRGCRVYTLHKPVRKRYVTRPYRAGYRDAQWQEDLVEMIPYEEENDGHRYLLMVIDVFSRYAWV